MKEVGPSSKTFWHKINMISSMPKNELINMFPEVFIDEIGIIKVHQS